MKFLRKILDDVKPHFEEGGKLEKLHTSFDALETFLFVPRHTTKGREVHIRDGIDLKRTMITVVIALIPTLLFGIWNTGHQHYLAMGELAGLNEGLWEKLLIGLEHVLPIIIVSYAVGLGIEFMFTTMRGEQVHEGFLVSGMLIPLVMPATIPLWMVGVATAFAVIIGKEAFGGTGMNILNIALTARAFVFFAYPQQISGNNVWIALPESDKLVDGFSGATPLAKAVDGGMAGFAEMQHVSYTFMDMFWGFIPGSIGETSFVAVMIGAAILILSGIGSWRIMLSVFAGGYAMGLLLNGLAVNEFMEIPAHYHLVMGGFAFGAVYMATDPVTAAQTNAGKYIYGFLIGLFAVLIRIFNPAYPEGMMLSILFFNIFAPLIDHVVIQRNMKKRLVPAKG